MEAEHEKRRFIEMEFANNGDFVLSNNLKVLFYNHSGEISGAEISLLLMMEHLRSVETLLVSPSGDLVERAIEKSIIVKRVRGYRARMSGNPLFVLREFFGSLLAGIELRKITKKYNPDIIHANSIRSGIIANLGLLGLHKKIIWHIRDVLPLNLVGMAIRMLARIGTSYVIAISHSIASDFSVSENLAKKTIVIHNGIEIKENDKISLRTEFGTSDQCFVIGVVGQIARWKRQLDAIKAFAELQSIYPNSELWIVGEPRFREDNVIYERELHKWILTIGLNDRVKFLGFRNDIASVMHSLDVILLPSDNEPFGRVIIEAMLANRPVVGTNAGGVPEIVVDGVTGYLVPVGGIKEMKEVLFHLAQHPELCENMGNNGMNRVTELFSIDSTVRAIEKLYEEVTQ